MKIVIISTLLAFASMLCHGQSYPEIGSIIDITPEWTYVSVDTNWYQSVPNNPHFDEYNGRTLIDDHINGDNYYFLELSFSNHLLLFLDGYFLHKIDLETGLPQWVHRSNYYSGNEHLVTSFIGDFDFSAEGNIKVNAFKSIKPISQQTNNFNYYVNVMQQTIDESNGTLLHEIVDTTTAETRRTNRQGHILKGLNNGYKIKTRTDGVYENDTTYNRLIAYITDPQGIESSEPSYTYTYNTGIRGDATAINFPGGYLQINKNLGVAYFMTADLINAGQQPTDISLVYFDTSNPLDIQVSRTIDVTPYSPLNQTYNTGIVNMRVSDNKIMVFQKSRFENSDSYTWMAYYDLDGNLINHIDRVGINNEDFDFIDIVDSEDDEDYFLGYIRGDDANPLDRYFIIKYDQNGQPVIISQFARRESDDEISFRIFNPIMLENKDVLFYTHIDYPAGAPASNSYSALHRFSSEEMGIPTSTQNITSDNDLKLKVYPNPSSNNIQIKGLSRNDKLMSILDTNGNVLKTLESDQSNINVSNLSSGQYFIKVENVLEGTKMVPFIKI